MPNPDVAALHAFLAAGTPRAVDTNPLLAALGARLEAWDPGARSLTLSFAPGPTFRQGAGVLQGGAISAMLDFAMAFAAFATLPPDRMAVTASMSLQFMASAAAERFRAAGYVVRPGRRLVFTAATLFNEGTPLATATSTLAVVENA